VVFFLSKTDIVLVLIWRALCRRWQTLWLCTAQDAQRAEKCWRAAFDREGLERVMCFVWPLSKTEETNRCAKKKKKKKGLGAQMTERVCCQVRLLQRAAGEGEEDGGVDGDLAALVPRGCAATSWQVRPRKSQRPLFVFCAFCVCG
jgi:hypothetical protein